MSENMLY